MKYGGIEFETKYIFVSSIKMSFFHNISVIFDNYVRISFVKLVEQLNMNEKCCQFFCFEGLSLRV